MSCGADAANNVIEDNQWRVVVCAKERAMIGTIISNEDLDGKPETDNRQAESRTTIRTGLKRA
jgi:hypothetical protein